MIRLLRDCAEVDDGREPRTRAAVLYDDFIKSGYLQGAAARDHKGIPNRYIIQNMTVSGRLFLQELETSEKAASVFGRMKKFALFSGGWILGICTQTIIAIINQKFLK